jgi:hypothetical protein
MDWARKKDVQRDAPIAWSTLARKSKGDFMKDSLSRILKEREAKKGHLEIVRVGLCLSKVLSPGFLAKDS